MKRLTGMMLVLTAILPASMALAQDGPVSHYDQLKGLEWLVGTFSAEMKAEEDIPGIVQAGEMYQGTVDCEWQLNKNIIAVHIVLKAKGITFWEHRGMIGWDPISKQIISRSFNSIGGHAQGVFSKNGQNWETKTSGVNGEGKKTSGTGVLFDIVKDSFSVQSVDIKEDGVPQPDAAKITWKRVTR